MPTTAAELATQAATAVHTLAVLSRPAITPLDADELRATTCALAQLTAALPQTLRQLRAYLPAADGDADPARDGLHQASGLAAHLAAALDTTYQALGDLAETTETNTEGVNIQPAIRGQFSNGVDTACRTQPGELACTSHEPCAALHAAGRFRPQ